MGASVRCVWEGIPWLPCSPLHFATSVTAAHVLSDTRKVAGAFGWAYAATLGLALVYLGEHYVADLAAGLALRREHPGRPAAADARRPTGSSHALQADRGQGAGRA